jgi:integrase/recombinase XerD
MKLGRAVCGKLLRDTLSASGYKESSIRRREYDLGLFFGYLEKNGTRDLREVGAGQIEGFLRYLNGKKSPVRGRTFSVSSKLSAFHCLRCLFRILSQEELILANPIKGLEVKFKPDSGRRVVLSQEEMGRLLDGIDVGRPLGLRDRAMFELMYSTGMRVQETINLKVEEIDLDGRQLLVRESKWGKDRVVPVSKVAAEHVERYLGSRGVKAGPVFVCIHGKLGKSAVNRRFQKWAREAGVMKSGLSTHSIRHAVATHMLANGADLRYVQELLGHSSIETTVRYTHELTENLRRIYRSYHPRENELRRELDGQYLAKVEALRKELARARAKTTVRRGSVRRWYERNRRGRK